jgi:hypothetical protein
MNKRYHLHPTVTDSEDKGLCFNIQSATCIMLKFLKRWEHFLRVYDKLCIILGDRGPDGGYTEERMLIIFLVFDQKLISKYSF